MRVLSIFDCSNKIRDAFRLHGCKASSLDMHPGYKNTKVDYITNILDFDYQAHKPNKFNFLFIALPCQVYSIASGAFHFKNNIPKTTTAITHINILIKVYQITQYFNCPFIIENPSGGLINNSFFKSFFKLEVTRVSLKSFGYPTQKKTDLFHNFDWLFISNPVHRVNGKYQAQLLDNMTYRQRVTYPEAFVSQLVQSVINHFNSI
jgi:hypothetical protein